jgi:hypothetical protein
MDDLDHDKEKICQPKQIRSGDFEMAKIERGTQKV